MLLVEDISIIALDIEETLTDFGVDRISLAMNCAQALAILQSEPDVDAALLDLYLGSGTCEPVAEALCARDIPFILVTSLGGPLDLVGQWPTAPILHKPFGSDALMSALERLG